jgi:transposase
MRMLSAYKFRLYPDEEREKVINNQLGICKELYNGARHERLEHYEVSMNQEISSCVVDEPVPGDSGAGSPRASV